MNLIAAVDNNWGIGKDNDLLFHIKSDLRYFQGITKNKIIIMGRKTWESLPKKPLKNRINVILTKDKNFTFKDENVIIYNDINFMLKDLLKKYKSKDIFVIGGESIYKQFLPYCQYFYITHIFEDGNANKFLPNLDKDKTIYLSYVSKLYKENNYNFCFSLYSRNYPVDKNLKKITEKE